MAVTAAIASLAPNTTYHFRISATNAGGTSKGADETFKTLPNPPTVVTKPASSITQTTATLNATVNPNSGEVSKCEFEYGTSNAYGSTAACSVLPGSGSSPVAVTAAIASLTANTTYHFRISATNAGGTSKGADETLQDASEPADGRDQTGLRDRPDDSHAERHRQPQQRRSQQMRIRIRHHDRIRIERIVRLAAGVGSQSRGRDRGR